MPHTALEKVLYVEDDEGLARLMQKRMKRRNLSVTIAFSAEEGLKKLENEKYDLVLIDYHLPTMNGLEMFDVIRTRYTSLPVIILTASGDERIALTALEKGAADYAIKDSGQTYLDLLPAVMQAAYTKERLLRINELQTQELKIAKEKAEAANQAKSSFLATMSHEMRTPLNVVIGLSRLLSEMSMGEKERNMLNTLMSNAELLMKLINDLLDLSRIEAGQIELENNSFSLPKLFDDISTMFQTQATEKNLRLVITNTIEVTSVIGDRTRIQQIIMNLVSNAIKFTKSGEVRINASAEKKNDRISITIDVSDTGIGIPDEKLATIFDKFTQADETITRRFGGSGLGLSIARSLTTLMGGNITVKSKEGVGSVFSVNIILEEASPHNKQKLTDHEQGTKSDNNRYNGTVLVVEDYAPNIMVATMMLENIGFNVLTAENGMEALECVTVAARPFTAILMDVQMYDMDGLETTRRIRALETQKGFRNTIIGVTAHALAGDREKCIAAGMDDYISKPIHPNILNAKLQKLCCA